MTLVPKLPKKVQYLVNFSFPLINKLCPRKAFVGGRIGYPKDEVFIWLLIKKVTNFDYRTIGDMAGYSHTTLVRANQKFLNLDLYHKVLVSLVKKAYKEGLIEGKKVALDSSFVKTYSKREEFGSGGFNGKKEAYGFKVHVLIDCISGFPIALIVGNGLDHDSQVAIPLLKKARYWLKGCGYVIADKGYDSSDIVTHIVKKLHAKAAIKIRKLRKTKRGRKIGTYLNWKLKAKGRTFKKSILNLRSEIERFFSTLKRTFNLGRELTRGIRAFTGNALLACICFMLRKLFGLGVICI